MSENSSGNSSSFSSFENSVLEYLSLSIGGVAVIACVTVIIENIRHGKIVSLMHSSSMPLFLMFSDLLLSMSTMIGASQINQCTDKKLCIFVALLSQFSSLSSFMWTAAISNTSFQQVSQLFSVESQFRNQSMSRHNSFNFKTKTKVSSNKSMLFYHLCCWGLPFLTVIIMLATSSAGFSDHSCWLVIMPTNSSHMPLVVAILFYWFPLLTLVLYNLRVFRFLANTIRQIPFSQSLLKRFTRYLSIVIAVKTIFVIYRGILLFNPVHSNFGIVVFCILCGPLQGLGDFLVLLSGRFQDGGNAIMEDETEQRFGRENRQQNNGLHGSQHSVRSVDALMGAIDDMDIDDIELTVHNPISDDSLKASFLQTDENSYNFVEKDEEVEIELNTIPL